MSANPLIDLVTVGVVTFNRAHYLGQAVSTAISQEDNNFEILIVDDGSSDNTEQVVQSFSDPRVRYLKHPKNKGRAEARNTVVQNMNGSFLMWLDDDDGLAPNAISAQRAFLSAHPEQDILYCDHVRCDSDLNPKDVRPSKDAQPGQMLMQLLYEDIIPNGGTFIRREVFERVGGYHRFTSSNRCEDYDLWVKAAIAGCKFLRNPMPLYHFRFHEENLGNPEVTRDDSWHQCLIVKSAMENAKLEDLFPVLPWAAKPQESAATALMLLARIFFDHGDDRSALECLEASLQFHKLQRVQLMRAFVLRSLKQYERAAQAFADVCAETDDELRGMNVEIGAPRGSAKAAEAARKASKGS